MNHLSFMRTFILLCILSVSVSVHAQQVVAVTTQVKKVQPVDTIRASFIRHSLVATMSVGFINDYRQNYSVPVGFRNNNTTGFAPIYLSAEYGISNHVGIAATACYDGFYGNYLQLYTMNGREYQRSKTDQIDIYSGGLALYYHFGNVIPIKKLDLFLGAGFSLNNIRHSNMPQGDSTTALTERTTTPVLKAGARYYISNKASLFANLGIDKHSLFSLGFSCRFMKKGS